MIQMYKFNLLLFFFGFFLFKGNAHAQQRNYYIYFQQYNYTPFYIKYESKVYSSTDKGFLILSKLKSGTHKIEIGFPKSQEKSLSFICSINDNDLGFVIKKQNDNWILSNLNHNNSISQVAPPDTVVAEILKEVPKEIPSEVKNQLIVDTTVVVSKKEEQKEPVPTIEPVVDKIPTDVIRNEVNLLFRKSSDQGTDLIYIVTEGSKNDTIRVFIPKSTAIIDPPTLSPTHTKDTATKKDNKFLNFELKNPNNGEKDWAIPEPKNKDTMAKAELVNTTCKKIANDDDYITLRKKMAGELNETKMIELAKKAFEQRCFMTQHIKNLSVLFIDENNKFDFIKLSYSFVYDSQSYASLGKLFSNQQFISQFNSLISK
jgi:hypothetical protein